MGAIGRRLVEAGWRTSDVQSEIVALAADFADSSEWAVAGYSTPGRWIAEMLDIAPRTANEWIRVGRCLRELPGTAAALDARRISFTKAKELTRSATGDNETELLAIAERTPAARLGREIAAWLQQTEPDEAIDRRQHDARSLRWQTEPDGTISFDLRLPPAAAGVVMAAVDAEVMRQAQVQRDSEDWPSLAQQRADALTHVLRNGGAAATSEVIVHLRGDGATLDDGTPITSTAVAHMIDDAFIRALIHDANGRPINASARRRHPTTRQKRVVKERDRVCVDCGSTDLLEYDHVPDFAETGHTIVEELELRCATCHQFRHRRAG
jgi:hypothetical protein